VSRPCTPQRESFRRDHRFSHLKVLAVGFVQNHHEIMHNAPASVSRHSGRFVINPGVDSTHFNRTATAMSDFRLIQQVQVVGYFFTKSIPPLSAYISPSVCVASKRESNPSDRSSDSRMGMTLCKTPAHERNRRLIKSCDVRMDS